MGLVDYIVIEPRVSTEFECPKCGSSYFGSYTHEGQKKRACHGDNCHFTWLVKDDGQYFYLITKTRIPQEELRSHGLGIED